MRLVVLQKMPPWFETIVSLITIVWSLSLVSSRSFRQNGRYCLSPEGQPIPAGARYRSDPCTKCHCPRQGGRARCAVEDCFLDSTCLSWERLPNVCCGRCLEHGCRHRNGTVYPIGAIILDTPCEVCLCPEHGGRSVCEMKVDCPSVRCVDPVVQSGECCPACARGNNCWHGNTLLQGNETLVINEKCMICACPTEDQANEWRDQYGPIAVCVDLPSPCVAAP